MDAGHMPSEWQPSGSEPNIRAATVRERFPAPSSFPGELDRGHRYTVGEAHPRGVTDSSWVGRMMV